MLKKSTYGFALLFLFAALLSFKGDFRSAAPPNNVSGAPGGGICTNCHTTNGLNTGGGSVVINGLPATFQPGVTYPFSVTISHGTADRQRWGFEVNARNANNVGIGTFSPGSNPNAGIVNSIPSQIGHVNAVITAASNSYTYSGLSWTAPSTINAGDNQVTFYAAGNAANNNGANTGDFIYSNTLLFPLPIQLKDVNYKIVDGYKVVLDWQTETEANSKEFVIEKSDDNAAFFVAGRVAAAGQSSTERSYKFSDARPSYFNRPIYYRLKLVDNDGQFKYSQTIQVTLSAKATYLCSLTPNPASDYILAGIVAEKAQAAELRITSASGQVWKRKTVSLQNGKTDCRIEVTDLPKGMYYLCFNAGSIQQAIGFLKH